jgi:primosomal protein N''
VAQAVERLLCNCEALNSNPSSTENKTNNPAPKKPWSLIHTLDEEKNLLRYMEETLKNAILMSIRKSPEPGPFQLPYKRAYSFL